MRGLHARKDPPRRQGATPPNKAAMATPTVRRREDKRWADIGILFSELAKLRTLVSKKRRPREMI